jgi:hypothetical protein
MVHPDVEDRNTGILSVVPDAPEEPESVGPADSEASEKPQQQVTPLVLWNPKKIRGALHAFGLALAFAGVVFVVTDYLEAHGSLEPLTPQQSGELSSFISGASRSQSQPPVLFVHVDDSWELLSTESRQEEAEALFATAKANWGVRDGFIHRGKALVAQCWGEEVTVYGSLHGDSE